jgi:hypothetical protein
VSAHGGAAELLDVARENLEHGHPADSVSRAYYAMFHAATAVLLERGIERSSHGALISAFSEYIVKPGLLDKRYHASLRRAFDERSDSDYFASPRGTPDDAKEMILEAEEFVAACGRLL